MTHDFLTTLPAVLRIRLGPLLPERAFLRRDRGDALFITNAPALADCTPLLTSLGTAGFLCETRGNLMRISPGPNFLVALEQALAPCDFLSQSLERLRGRIPCAEALALFAQGIRLLEHAAPSDTDGYVRRTRQLAAICLRKKLGGAYACALICHTLKTRKESII